MTKIGNPLRLASEYRVSFLNEDEHVHFRRGAI